MTDAIDPAPTSRTRWIVAWVASCLVVGTAAAGASLLVTSPWDKAAHNAATEPVVTAAAEVRSFPAPAAQAVGTLTRGQVSAVSIAPAEGKQAVVTAVHAAVGDPIASGQAVIDISGRPVIALSLPFALYRDIVPGDAGPDVSAIQDELTALGLYRGPKDGTYGHSTAKAVRALYTQAGVAAPEPSTPATTAASAAAEVLDAARTAAETAHRQLAAAEKASVAADATASPSSDLDDLRAGVTTADTAVTRATQAKADADLAADTPLPRSEIVRITAAGTTLAMISPVGAELAGDDAVAFSLRNGEVVATVRVGVSDAPAFAVGQPVAVSAATDVTGTIPATVTAVSEFQQASGTQTLPGFDVTLGFADPATVTLDDGAAVLAVAGSTDADTQGLAVPLISVREAPAGTYVIVEDGTKFRHVSVQVTMTADGYALVTSTDLAEGDTVVVSGAP